MALALFAHTPRVHNVSVSASRRSELGKVTPSRYLAVGWNTHYYCYYYVMNVSTAVDVMGYY